MRLERRQRWERQYLNDEVWRGDVAGQAAEVEAHPSVLVGHQLGVVLVVQGDPGQRPGDGGWVARVHLLEDNWGDEDPGEDRGVRR